MPLPSYDELKRRAIALQLENSRLKEDVTYGVLTRSALQIDIEKLTQRGLFVLVFQIKNVGHVRGVRRVLGIRDPHILLRGVWSLDEFVFVLDREPDELIEKLRVQVTNEGLDGCIAYVSYSRNIGNDVGTCQSLNQAHREGYQA